MIWRASSLVRSRPKRGTKAWRLTPSQRFLTATNQGEARRQAAVELAAAEQMILQDLSTGTAPDAALPVALALEEEAVGAAGFVDQLLQLFEHPAMLFAGFRVHWTHAFVRAPRRGA